MDLKLFYDLKMKGYNVRIFADVTNVFNKENVLAVDNSTGEPLLHSTPDNHLCSYGNHIILVLPGTLKLGLA